MTKVRPSVIVHPGEKVKNLKTTFRIFGKRYRLTGGGLLGLCMRSAKPAACLLVITCILAAYTACEGEQDLPTIIEDNFAGEEPADTWNALGEFELTAYCGCELCCGAWSDEKATTASGTHAAEGRTVAVDTDIIPLGSIVEIDGHEYIAEDTGSAIQGERIDIYFNSHSDALAFGRQSAQVKIKQSV
jgi:3D (Asp-Asp-Asp) domain-containing protein